MSPEPASDLKFEIGHVLFIDIVGYSKLLINEQSELIRELKEIVRGTEQVRLAEAEGKLVRLPTGDGTALVFRNSPEEPARCALEISEALKNHPRIQLRMGIHSGPVNEVPDVNERTNITGAGINVAQRVMDCGDAGHILLSKHVADDLEQYPQWRSHLHELGECEVKHGVHVAVVNLYTEELGNPEVPEKLKRADVVAAVSAAAAAGAPSRRRYLFITGAVALIIAAAALGVGFWKFYHSAAQKLTSPSRVMEKSIAVLPFENFSEDKAFAFFADV